MWKEFFYYSKNERRGVLVLFVLTALSLGGAFLYSYLTEPDVVVEAEEWKEYDEFIASVHELDSVRYGKYKSSAYKEQPVILAPFDPNTADSSTLVSLGLKPYIARNILRYRAKGGKFRTPEAFSKIYGLTSEQYKVLLPYITIGEAFQKQQDTVRIFASARKDSMQHFKYPTGTILNLNIVDTTELKKIPGIGSGIARMIVAYRTRLGGFYKVEQLQEIKYVSDTLNRWFKVNNSPIHRINLNKASVERMKAHPYINFYQAKVIAEYRKRKGKLYSLKQLSLYEEFTAKDIDRLQYYICFE